MKQTPYTTKSGLQIGRYYAPQQRPHHDEDACLLQAALLGIKREFDWDGVLIAAAIVLAIVAAFLWML